MSICVCGSVCVGTLRLAVSTSSCQKLKQPAPKPLYHAATYVPRTQMGPPCFAWSLGFVWRRLTFKNRGHWGSNGVLGIISSYQGVFLKRISEKYITPLKLNEFIPEKGTISNRKIHLPTIDFPETCSFSGGYIPFFTTKKTGCYTSPQVSSDKRSRVLDGHDLRPTPGLHQRSWPVLEASANSLKPENTKNPSQLHTFAGYLLYGCFRK